jgi:hypothetical protein
VIVQIPGYFLGVSEPFMMFGERTQLQSMRSATPTWISS